MNDLLSLSKNKLSQKKIIDWGYTEELTPRTYKHFVQWVDDDYAGNLNYLVDERKEKRKSLLSVFPECRSALVFLFDYTPTKKKLLSSNTHSKIASYTMGFEGIDYHHWIKDKLISIGEELKLENKNLDYKISLDVHPVLERDLAMRAGLGWFGKNTMLISKSYGSYNLIGSLLLNHKLELGVRETEVDHCGNCRRCIDACPTSAIDLDGHIVDAKKCISTFTIEEFKPVPAPKGYPVETKEIFGCDICQEVCPWNTKPINSVVAEELDSKLVSFFNRSLELIFNDIQHMSNNQYKQFFRGTSFERSGKKALLKNLKPYL